LTTVHERAGASDGPENEFNRAAYRERLRERSDRDLLITATVEVAALKFSLDQLRRRGCDRFAGLNREVGEHGRAIQAIQNGATTRLKTGLSIAGIVIAGAAVVVAVLVAVFK